MVMAGRASFAAVGQHYVYCTLPALLLALLPLGSWALSWRFWRTESPRRGLRYKVLRHLSEVKVLGIIAGLSPAFGSCTASRRK